jgi:transcriptional regulator with XRE-family HTH domain
LTLIDLAEKVGYSAHAYLSEVERELKAPTLDLVLAVAAFFKVSVDDLLDEDRGSEDLGWG